MNLDKKLPALVMKNLEDNMGVITKYLKQTEDKALVFIIGETGSGKSCLAELEVPDALYPTAQQFEECDHISEMFTGFDVVIDDIFRFDADKVLECILAVHASGHKVLVIGQPSDHELCIGLLSRLPVGYRAMFVNLMGHQDLQEMSGDGKDKGNSETKNLLH
ncbi:TPA: hypothetical protein ACRYB7_005236 [Klebsiella pneumoniae]